MYIVEKGVIYCFSIEFASSEAGLHICLEQLLFGWSFDGVSILLSQGLSGCSTCHHWWTILGMITFTRDRYR
ncbi:hypothetical protein Nepgr_018288 [Nepenthes gracilis]|uniref:Uncharacterized protein n=1 Tax=Nepenthes gracilis TaxID=150966 RepID=A0AAD3SSN2_NEPGR|nr:hypothetical protein Nepgr_018288 [Nepenthes gracilis]